MKTIKENIEEIERIVAIIENHCLCSKLEKVSSTHYIVYPAENWQVAESCMPTARSALCDLAMYLEKLWIHSGLKPLNERIKLVQMFRDENHLHYVK